ncbi:MAG: beta-lactamase family protein [Caulobacteraceae bacterium]|nr:beta-lactamase family protein [Caulobacteraceae bacterium]
MFTRRDFSLAVGAGGLMLGGCANAGSRPDMPATPAATSPLSEAMSGTAVPGMAAIVIRNFSVETEYFSGVRAVGSPAMVAPNDRWHLGSDGKAMTATLVAKLVDAGVLSWEQPLSDMLPDLATRMQAAYRGVTLPDLLSHRAGLPENISDLDFFMAFHADTASPTAQRLRYIDRCLQEAPVGPAREGSSYSNTGFIIAAACAEHATGRAFEDMIVREVFDPLGIHSISFDQFGGAGEPQGHVDGRIADQVNDVNPRMFAPAGAMRMTLQDWSRFCIDQMRGEHGRGRLLRTETYRFVHAPQGDTRTALGWGAAPHPMNLRGPALTHSGSDGNWYALVCLFPETGNGVLVAANAAENMQGDQASVAALRALAASVAEPFEG